MITEFIDSQFLRDTILRHYRTTTTGGDKLIQIGLEMVTREGLLQHCAPAWIGAEAFDVYLRTVPRDRRRDVEEVLCAHGLEEVNVVADGAIEIASDMEAGTAEGLARALIEAGAEVYVEPHLPL